MAVVTNRATVPAWVWLAAGAAGLVACSSEAPAPFGAATSSTASSASSSSGATTSASSGSSSQGGGGSGQGGATSAASTSSQGGGGGTPIDCEPGGLGPGVHELSLDHGGSSRSYRLFVPESYDASAAVPLVLSFHGYTSNDGQHASYTDMDADAEARGVVVAYPQGVANSWNGGACCGQAASGDVDDVDFAQAVVADVSATLCIDPARVFATGFSNGGFLSHRLACEAADTFAAIAPVSGVIGVESCSPSRAVPVIHFHGTSDFVVPYNGNAFIGYPSVEDTIAGWVERNGCQGEPTTTFDEGNATCIQYAGCDDGAHVTLCSVSGLGHCWPGAPSCNGNGALHANTALFDFFAAHPMP